MRDSAFTSGLYLEELPPFEQCQMQSVEIDILPRRPDKKADSTEFSHLTQSRSDVSAHRLPLTTY
jgi:hypothetical protein